jgi:hypothetical protein
LWTGDHSATRIGEGLTVGLSQATLDTPNSSQLSIHVINVAAGHSVPTGSNRRAVYLTAEVLSGSAVVASTEWMFAPWYGNRPDDRSFVDADQSLPDVIAATQADAQGPHEPPVRAGEDRVLTWTPAIPKGNYTLRATLTYDLNRYNDRSYKADQTQIFQTSISVSIP